LNRDNGLEDGDVKDVSRAARERLATRPVSSETVMSDFISGQLNHNVLKIIYRSGIARCCRSGGARIVSAFRE